MTEVARRILVVEDETDIRSLLALHLRREGYDVTTVPDGEAALAQLEANPYHLVMLDWMLPGISGLDLCRRLDERRKAGATTAILMLTARANASDVVLALDCGADDYVTKPFELPILLARVRSVLRRNLDGKPLPRAKMSWGTLTLDPDDFNVKRRGEEVPLTPYEFKLLFALMSAQGKVLTRSSLIGAVQGEGVAVTDRTIDTHIFGLRKKLGDAADLVETIRGVGYRVKAAG